MHSLNEAELRYVGKLHYSVTSRGSVVIVNFFAGKDDESGGMLHWLWRDRRPWYR